MSGPRQRLERCSHKPRTVWSQQKQGGKEGTSPRASEEHCPADLGLGPLASRLQEARFR